MKILLCILLLIIGCKSETVSDKPETVNADTATYTATETQEPVEEEKPDRELLPGGIFQFEDDDIGEYPFLKDFEPMLASIGNFEILKKTVRNMQDSTQTDTLITVNFGKSAIEYYKMQAGASGFITGATIESNAVEFKKGIKVGMGLDEFVSLFGELEGKENLHSVIISTLEGLSQTEFVFVNNRLSTIKYQSYFD